MKKLGMIVCILVVAFLLAIAFQNNSTNDAPIKRTADGTRIYTEDQMTQALDSDGDAVIYLDGHEPVDQQTIDALPPCDDVAKVEPPKGSQERCRTPQGDQTLISVYWEDNFMKKESEAPIPR